MSPEYTAAELESLYKQIYTDGALPALEAYAKQPVPKDAKLAILRWHESGLSLPNRVTQAVGFEAHHLEEFYNQRCDALQIPHPPDELRLSTLYPYAPSCLLVAEEHLRRPTDIEGVVEEALKEGVHRYGKQRILTDDSLDVTVAEGHVLLQDWLQRLQQDPSGFSLIDGIVSGELPSQLVHSIIRPREMPYMRVIELGAQRYKSFYQAASQ